MRIYEGRRNADGSGDVTIDGRKLNPRLDLRNHSPTGLNWGYSGSGPAQLALAILAHHFFAQGPSGEDHALALYQDFKRRVVAGLPDRWRLTSDQISAAVREIEGEVG